MSKIESIAVFCGSSSGNDPAIWDTTVELGAALAEKKIRLIFGGGKVGIMGILADSVIENGGKVTGVIPSFLRSKEIAHIGTTELISTHNMHERKEKIYELADAFLVLPGGYGTLDELFEIVTWAQLGLHQKPICIININGYFDALRNLIVKMTDQGFLKLENATMIRFASTIEQAFFELRTYIAPKVGKWIKEEDL